MAEITPSSSLEELAAIISQALESADILATLSGGAAVSIYTNNRYQSQDLDFVSSAAPGKLAKAVAALGFVTTDRPRLFAHPQTPWLLEFPAGPLGFIGSATTKRSGWRRVKSSIGQSWKHGPPMRGCQRMNG